MISPRRLRGKKGAEVQLTGGGGGGTHFPPKKYAPNVKRDEEEGVQIPPYTLFRVDGAIK